MTTLNDIEPLPERWFPSIYGMKDGRFLNRRKDTDDQIEQEDQPDYRSNYQRRTVWVRYRICEHLRDHIIPRRRNALKKWRRKYSDYRYARNGVLRWVKKIPFWTLRDWLYKIARVPSEMENLKKRVMALPRHLRRRRRRLPVLKQRWGKTPFAERLVVEKRKFLKDKSHEHGVEWCVSEFNRILRTPWMWTIAERYVTPYEARCWRSRGRMYKKNMTAFKVYYINILGNPAILLCVVQI